ncbi:MAG TPA: asparagine synthase (glutamine-hydrolyzing) [Burkholderiales bacterium]|nr:asparagine synthase (glutamine-hydrolyzing) [Burkholderiales bacterium]
MCGLAGFVSASPVVGAPCRPALLRALDAIRHRGPDDRGTFFDSHAALGHNRLSIIDLSPRGRQPMAGGDAALQVVFNGEIYNFKKLRSELVEAGHGFLSDTDTEVLVHGYRKWGFRELLERIEGMFAFALWDAQARKLFLARDPFGIKPLYYVRHDDALVFGSELKAISAWQGTRPTIDADGLLLSFQHIGVPAPATVFAGYRQLEPGSWLEFDAARNELKSGRYWSWKVDPEIRDPELAMKLLWEAIIASVEKHLIADVPVGVFLSGGLDSSLITAACAELGRKPECLTISLPDSDHDETPYAKAVCDHFGLPHWVEKMDAGVARPFDSALASTFDEPFASSAALSAALVAARAATRYKVMLSGDGGDELFGGYRWYRTWLERYGEAGETRAPSLRDRWRMLRGGEPAAADPLQGYAQLMRAFSSEQMTQLFDPALLNSHRQAADAAAAYRAIAIDGRTGFDRLQTFDIALFLPSVCLTKMDRTSMAVSLEVRVPLLDKSVADLTGRIPESVRNPQRELKGLIKRLAREKLPPKVVAKRKEGFSTPVKRWFSKREMLAEIAGDAQNGDWWRGVFAPGAATAAKSLKGRPLWRFWHTWRWVKRYQ